MLSKAKKKKGENKTTNKNDVFTISDILKQFFLSYLKKKKKYFAVLIFYTFVRYFFFLFYCFFMAHRRYVFSKWVSVL